MSSGAKMPFSASASAIMFAIVLRYAIGSCVFASTSSTDMPCDCFAPQRRSSSRTMSLPLTHGLEPAGERHAPRFREREVDVAGGPAEPERRRSDAHADRAVGAVRAAVRVGAGDELAGHHERLLRKVEVEDAVARRRVVRLLDAVEPRELPADRRLLVVVVFAGEDEVIVGDRRLARQDRVPAGDLVEGVNRERRGAVGGRQQIGVDAQGGAGRDLGRTLRKA